MCHAAHAKSAKANEVENMSSTRARRKGTFCNSRVTRMCVPLNKASGSARKNDAAIDQAANSSADGRWLPKTRATIWAMMMIAINARNQVATVHETE